MRRAFRSVRARTTWVAAGAFGVAFVIAAFTLVRVVDVRVHDQARRTTHAALQIAVQQIEARRSPEQIEQALQEPVFVQIYDRNGTRLDKFPMRSIAKFDKQGHIVSYTYPTGGEYFVLPQVVPIVNTDTGESRLGWLVVASSLESANRGVATLRTILWFTTPGLIALVALIVWLLVGRALRPVDEIRNEVESISSRTIDRRVPVPDTGDEVARLATTMNAMLDRLEAAQRRQREFVSDASHELRSPVSSMRTELEVALAHPEAADWPGMAQRVLGEHDRLERLVGDLLQLARLDEGRALRLEEIDIDDIVLAEAAHARRLPVRTAAVSAGRVLGEHRALEQVVRNLLDNAVRHGEAEVAVGVHADSNEIVITIDDDGPGVASEDRDRIFERFARVDAGRARDDGGTGLGLALVRRVVEAHGGTVGYATSPLGGARFEVRLPAASETASATTAELA
jgi:signal transduction histidine kinase